MMSRAMAQERVSTQAAIERVDHSVLLTREDFSRATVPLRPALFRLCMALCRSREEAEDLLQNAMVKAFLHRASFRGEAPLVSWLYSIVRHERAESVRMGARRRGLLRNAFERFGLFLEDLVATPDETPEAIALKDESAEALLDAVRALPEPYREIVWMSDIEELSYEMIASALGIPLGTVKSRHARGRARLRTQLEAEQQEGAR